MVREIISWTDPKNYDEYYNGRPPSPEPQITRANYDALRDATWKSGWNGIDKNPDPTNTEAIHAAAFAKQREHYKALKAKEMSPPADEGDPKDPSSYASWNLCKGYTHTEKGGYKLWGVRQPLETDKEFWARVDPNNTRGLLDQDEESFGRSPHVFGGNVNNSIASSQPNAGSSSSARPLKRRRDADEDNLIETAPVNKRQRERQRDRLTPEDQEHSSKRRCPLDEDDDGLNAEPPSKKQKGPGQPESPRSKIARLAELSPSPTQGRKSPTPRADARPLSPQQRRDQKSRTPTTDSIPMSFDISRGSSPMYMSNAEGTSNAMPKVTPSDLDTQNSVNQSAGLSSEEVQTTLTTIAASAEEILAGQTAPTSVATFTEATSAVQAAPTSLSAFVEDVIAARTPHTSIASSTEDNVADHTPSTSIATSVEEIQDAQYKAPMAKSSHVEMTNEYVSAEPSGSQGKKKGKAKATIGEEQHEANTLRLRVRPTETDDMEGEQHATPSSTGGRRGRSAKIDAVDEEAISTAPAGKVKGSRTKKASGLKEERKGTRSSPRGRPKKHEGITKTQNTTPKTRGRPKKTEGDVKVGGKAPRKQGKAKESADTSQEGPLASTPKQRGRPKKVDTPATQTEDKPKNSSDISTEEPTSSTNKHRGRPKKVDTPTAQKDTKATKLSDTLGDEPTSSTPKRRGRPSKVDAVGTPPEVEPTLTPQPKKRGRPAKAEKNDPLAVQGKVRIEKSKKAEKPKKRAK